jgi:hypothetical protein
LLNGKAHGTQSNDGLQYTLQANVRDAFPGDEVENKRLDNRGATEG